MDKYQKKYMDIFGEHCARIYSLDDKTKYGTIQYIDDKIIIKENDDITIRKYIAHVSNEQNLQNTKISITYDNKIYEEINYKNVITEQKQYAIRTFEIDFDKKIKRIKIEDKLNLINPIILSVEYIEADKEQYYARLEKNKKDNLRKNANVTHASGLNLVNIYFSPCNSDYSYTIITLYKDARVIAKYKSEENIFFMSISGLAFGSYEYELSQYDNTGNEIIKFDKIKFSINIPTISVSQY